MKTLRGLVMSITLLLGISASAQAVLIGVDADDFAAGTVLNNAFSGVTLSAIGATNIVSIAPIQPFTPTTGSLIFGHNGSLFPDGFGGNSSATAFRVDFATVTDLVLLDALGDNGSDFATLTAYDAGGFLLDTYTTGQMTIGSFETMTVSGVGIAYVIADQLGGDFVGYDYLRYNGVNGVPEPSILALMVAGLIGIGFAKRKTSEA